MRHCRLGFLLLISILLAACASPKPALTDFDREVNFTQYRTFAFYTAKEVQVEATEQAASYDPLITQHFKQAIREEMLALGYQEVTTAPELWVNYLTHVETRKDIRSSPLRLNLGLGHFSRNSAVSLGFPVIGTPVEEVSYQIGTVAIELIDVQENRVIWHGLAESRLSRQAMQQPQQAINDTVNLIFQRFPSRLNAP